MLISLVWRIILVHVVANTPIYINKLININTACTRYIIVYNITKIKYMIIFQLKLKLPTSIFDSIVDLHTISRKCANIFKLKHEASPLNIFKCRTLENIIIEIIQLRNSVYYLIILM